MFGLTPRAVGRLACFVNFGLLAFNLGFTRADALAQPNPGVFSPFGQLMILVWGLAFLFAGETSGNAPSALWFVFALEKACYVVSWVTWNRTHDVVALFSTAQSSGNPTDLLVPLFHAIYGPIDLSFLGLFASLGMQSMSATTKAERRKR